MTDEQRRKNDEEVARRVSEAIGTAMAKLKYEPYQEKGNDLYQAAYTELSSLYVHYRRLASQGVKSDEG